MLEAFGCGYFVVFPFLSVLVKILARAPQNQEDVQGRIGWQAVSEIESQPTSTMSAIKLIARGTKASVAICDKECYIAY